MGISNTVRIHYIMHAHVKGNWLIALMYLSVSDIECMCLHLNNFNLNILFYCSSIMLLLTLHVFITHLMAKYVLVILVHHFSSLLGSCLCIETLQY